MSVHEGEKTALAYRRPTLSRVKLIKIEGAINTLERVASPAYRRERERNRDGSFVTQYDQLEMR
ncbi:MAG: hypothetical protein WCC77_07960 [Pseudolabrys sp.]